MLGLKIYWLYSLEEVLGKSKLIDKKLKKQLIEEATDQLIPQLTKDAQKIDPTTTGIIALDWLNGRRTPDANQAIKGRYFWFKFG